MFWSDALWEGFRAGGTTGEILEYVDCDSSLVDANDSDSEEDEPPNRISTRAFSIFVSSGSETGDG